MPHDLFIFWLYLTGILGTLGLAAWAADWWINRPKAQGNFRTYLGEL
jgi:hypothetical protein